MANETVLTNKIFLNAVLPLVKVIATDVPSLAKKFEHMHAVFQVSALDPESPAGKVAHISQLITVSGAFVPIRLQQMLLLTLSLKALRP